MGWRRWSSTFFMFHNYGRLSGTYLQSHKMSETKWVTILHDPIRVPIVNYVFDNYRSTVKGFFNCETFEPYV